MILMAKGWSQIHGRRSQAQIHGLQRQVIALARIEAKESAVKGGPHHG